MNRLKNKVALITGASGGQGAEEALLFAREGATVALCDVQDKPGEAMAERIHSEGGQARYFHLDVSNEQDWKATVAAVETWRGPIDVLVNNAGIILRTGVKATRLEQWRKLLDINLTGAFLGIQTCAASMDRAGGGSIVNISSIAGRTGYYDAAYCASKWGLLGLTKTAAMELVDQGIRVNAICPGLIVTPLNANGPHLSPFRRMIPQGREGYTQEVAQLALFLASEESSYITGEDIAIDGGLLAGAATRRIAQESGAMQ